MIKVKELPDLERPYEKLLLYGAEKLSNAELLGIIIKTGNKDENVVTLAQKVLSIKKNDRVSKENGLKDLLDVKFNRDVIENNYKVFAKETGKLNSEMKRVFEIDDYYSSNGVINGADIYN